MPIREILSPMLALVLSTLCLTCSASSPAAGDDLEPNTAASFLEPDYRAYYPEPVTPFYYVYSFYGKTDYVNTPKIVIEYDSETGSRTKEFPLDFTPISIGGSASDLETVIIGGHNQEHEAVLMKFRFNFSSGHPVLETKVPFGNTNGLAVVSDFRFDEGNHADSLLAIDAKGGLFVRLDPVSPPTHLVERELSKQLVGKQSITHYTTKDGVIFIGFCEGAEDSHGEYSFKNALVLESRDSGVVFRETTPSR
jgi:hypothetical protein